MAVWLTRGDGDGDMCVVRKHESCCLMTDWWWGDGCVPVCAPCASMDEVTDASMRAFCKDKWGPIPKENTDCTYPVPRTMIGKMSRKRKHPDDKTTLIVDVKCPHCGFTHTVTYDGWAAIGCPCGTDLKHAEKL